MEANYNKMHTFVQRASRVLILSHRKPDADTLGASIALRIWLGDNDKSVTLACIDPPAPVFHCLPYVDEYVDEFNLSDYDLIVFVDVGAAHMTMFEEKYPNLFTSNIPIINIDHHASNEYYGDVNIVDSTAASATLIMYRIFSFLKIPITPDVATCLLAGIYGDTGSFMHSNTSAEVYATASDLMQKGAQIKEISNGLFRTKPVSTLKLWGKALEKVEKTSDDIVMSVVSESDYDLVGAKSDQLSGVIDYLNMVPGAKFSILINEDGKGHVKGSLRTQTDVDLSKVASYFGGGGHPKASGFMIPGILKKETKYTIVSDDMSKKSLDF